MNLMNVFLIVSAVALLVLVAVIAFYVFCAVLHAWEVAKMAKELEDNGIIGEDEKC